MRHENTHVATSSKVTIPLTVTTTTKLDRNGDIHDGDTTHTVVERNIGQIRRHTTQHTTVAMRTTARGDSYAASAQLWHTRTHKRNYAAICGGTTHYHVPRNNTYATTRTTTTAHRQQLATQQRYTHAATHSSMTTQTLQHAAPQQHPSCNTQHTPTAPCCGKKRGKQSYNAQLQSQYTGCTRSTTTTLAL